MRWLPLLACTFGCSPSLEEPPPTRSGVQISQGPAGGVDLEVAPDGTFWLAWVEEGRLVLAHGDGERFTTRQVPLDFEARASLARRPRLAVSEERVAITLSDGIVQDGRVVLLLGDQGAPELETTVLHALGPDLELDTLDQPTVAFDDAGALVASWKVGRDHQYGIVVAREGSAFEPVLARGFPGQPCECCPHELAFDRGDLLLLARGNVVDLREVLLGRETADGFDVTRVSRNGWVVAGCPFDGPRLARAGRSFWITWMDATDGEPRVWVSRSDDGQRWSDGERVLPDGPPRNQGLPTVFTVGERVFVTVEQVFEGTWLVEESDGSWAGGPVLTPGGPLVGVDAAGLGERGGLAGVDAEGRLWFVPVSGRR